MDELIQLLTGYPGIVPTAVLIFCLMWWVASLLAAAGDTGDAKTLRGGRPRHRAPRSRATGKKSGTIKRVFKLGSLPLSLTSLVVSFGAWAVCLLAGLGLNAADPSPVARTIAGTVILIVGLFVGLGLLSVSAIPAERVLVTHHAPVRRDAVGSTCTIRSMRNGAGDAKVTSGPTAGAIISVEAIPGEELAAGEAALVVAYDDVDERFQVARLDDVLR